MRTYSLLCPYANKKTLLPVQMKELVNNRLHIDLGTYMEDKNRDNDNAVWLKYRVRNGW